MKWRKGTFMAHNAIELHSLGYSVHRKPFFNLQKSVSSLLLLRLQVKGNCRVSLNGRPYEVGPGDLIFSKPSETYQLTVDASPGKESADYYLFCEGEWIERWLAQGGFPDCVRIEVNDDILSLWRRLIDEKRNLREDNSELMDYLLKALCLTLERSIRRRAGHDASSDLYMPYRIKRYVEQHATEPLTLEEIAKQHGISVSSASHLFKKTFKLSIIRYAVEVRLAVAVERILHTELPLEHISESCGFRSYPYFCRAFRSRYRIPPSQYRTDHRASHA